MGKGGGMHGLLGFAEEGFSKKQLPPPPPPPPPAVLPGCDALGYVACTGTNFCIRARALATVGWFPEYTITEDYALSMELKMAGLKGR